LYVITRKINDHEFLLVKQDWKFIKSLWPALVLSKPSEKLSVIRLKDHIVDLVNEMFYSTNINLEMPDSCVTAAANLWSNGMKPSAPEPTEAEIEKGKEDLRIRGENNLKIYNEILDSLLNALLENNLHWRHRLMAMNFIYVLMQPEHLFSPKIVRFFLSALIHESIDERKVALRMLMYIFKQLKKKHTKVICLLKSVS
jgi:proteasome activator subunit 4